MVVLPDLRDGRMHMSARLIDSGQGLTKPSWSSLGMSMRMAKHNEMRANVDVKKSFTVQSGWSLVFDSCWALLGALDREDCA